MKKFKPAVPSTALAVSLCLALAASFVVAEDSGDDPEPGRPAGTPGVRYDAAPVPEQQESVTRGISNDAKKASASPARAEGVPSFGDEIKSDDVNAAKREHVKKRQVAAARAKQAAECELQIKRRTDAAAGRVDDASLKVEHAKWVSECEAEAIHGANAAASGGTTKKQKKSTKGSATHNSNPPKPD